MPGGMVGTAGKGQGRLSSGQALLFKPACQVAGVLMATPKTLDAAGGAFGNMKEIDAGGNDDKPGGASAKARNALGLSTDFGVFVHILSPVMR
ncbi:hypothetical protein [Pseudomonas guariconensis]|uniref:hypothetical protein n=1 Tax=Pseudomonas guariconensis TaxID=1288410 RepID=UPI0023638015|nr:hypothetical protein [Pseudomonas guariconensis]